MQFFLALALWTASVVTISQATSSLPMAVSLFLYGIGLGIILPSVPVWIGEVVPASHLGWFSSYIIGTFGFIGQFFEAVIFITVLPMVGLRGILITVAGIGYFLLILIEILCKKRKKILTRNRL